jgi:DNA polymerase family A
MAYSLISYPTYSSEPSDLERLYGAEYLGLDLEYSGETPTILGLSDGKLHVSVPWTDGAPYLRELVSRYPATKFVGHNMVGADLPLLEGISLDQVEDTILWWYLTQMHLCKSSTKQSLDEEAGTGRKGAGYMNLWSMASVNTDFPHWKTCRGKYCSGPCPKCNPFWYNALDAAAPVIALSKLQRKAQLMRVDHLYPMHRKLMYVLDQMRTYGVFVDVPYIEELNKTFVRERAELAKQLPFNPNSPKQVVSHFKQWELEDAQQESINDLVEELGDSCPAELADLQAYKELGNGTDRWFAPQYRDSHGYTKGYRDPAGFVHPRLNPFTSSGRLACSAPNFQNVGKRKGEAMRRAIIAPPGWYIVRADLSNAENRVVLHFGGYTVSRDTDLHTWVAELAGLTPDMDFVKRVGGGKPRQAAKSIQHAGNILEGLQLKTAEQLRSKRIRDEISKGAREVHPDWTFNGKIVSFTGSNLSRRVYGDATLDHRRSALEIQAKYFARFPGIRTFQRDISKRCERDGVVRGPLGYCLLSFGEDTDRMKINQATWQQQPVSHVTKLALLTLWERWERTQKMRPVLQVHDEILCYCRNDVPPADACSWLVEALEQAVPEIPGLIIPADPTYGSSWAESDQREIRRKSS